MLPCGCRGEGAGLRGPKIRAPVPISKGGAPHRPAVPRLSVRDRGASQTYLGARGATDLGDC